MHRHSTEFQGTDGTAFLALLCLVVAAEPMRLAAQTTSIIEGTLTDLQGLAIAGAEITLSGPALRGEAKITSDATGSYRVTGLQAGIYKLRLAKPDFASKVYEGLIVTINRVLNFDVVLEVSTIQTEVVVSAIAPLIETAVSSSGATILPQQIEQMPINGRNYLDLMQLVRHGKPASGRGDGCRDADPWGARRKRRFSDRRHA